MFVTSLYRCLFKLQLWTVIQHKSAVLAYYVFICWADISADTDHPHTQRCYTLGMVQYKSVDGQIRAFNSALFGVLPKLQIVSSDRGFFFFFQSIYCHLGNLFCLNNGVSLNNCPSGQFSYLFRELRKLCWVALDIMAEK